MNNDSHTNYLKKHHTWYTVLGIGLVILGFLEVCFSSWSALFSVMYLGIFFIMSGIGEGVQAIQLHGLQSFILHALLSALYLIAGIALMVDPLSNAIALTLLLAILFFILGCLKIGTALTRAVLHRGWLLFDGLISVLLGALIWQEWPFNSLWILGTFVGINTLCTGFAWIMASSYAQKRAAHHHHNQGE